MPEQLSMLRKYFGTRNIKDSNLNITDLNNKLERNASQVQTESVIEELNRTIPNWKEGFY
jgi:hypothetical protein